MKCKLEPIKIRPIADKEEYCQSEKRSPKILKVRHSMNYVFNSKNIVNLSLILSNIFKDRCKEERTHCSKCYSV